MEFGHTIRNGNRFECIAEGSQVNGVPVERMRGEIAVIREGAATKEPVESISIETVWPHRGIFGVSARW